MLDSNIAYKYHNDFQLNVLDIRQSVDLQWGLRNVHPSGGGEEGGKFVGSDRSVRIFRALTEHRPRDVQLTIGVTNNEPIYNHVLCSEVLVKKESLLYRVLDKSVSVKDISANARIFVGVLVVLAMLTGLVKGLLLCCEAGDFPGNVTLQSDGSINSQLSLSMIHNVIILIVLIGGILGNIMILVVLSRPIFRGISYLYLGGVALAHLGVLVAWIPIYFRLRNEMGNTYPSVFYSAHLELVALNTCSIASTLIMSCLVIDRYIFVFFPTRIRAGKACKNARSFILYSFILGFSASAPQTGMRMVYEEAMSSFTLRENISVTGSTLWLVYIWSMMVLTRICPIVILIILNSLIIKRFLELNARKKQFQSVAEKFRSQKDTANLQNRNSRYREEQQLTVLTTCMISYFIITMIPSLVAVALYHYHADHNYSPFLDDLVIVTELSNFAIYIFLYALCSEQFRKELFKLLRSKCLEPTVPGPEQEEADGEFEDFSRHGTTIRLTPEQTKMNSPGSPRNEIN